ncbi:patatin-like phospholipase family protein [Granulicella sp. dw_53]|uniref:patatin-like phospholipase family protein n=1 Tax=Granulicella sp. dw_53 TaxID=2719792 RepID=UPI001BD3CD26|nr:patatin-like phospholipase family protein [Granulicella sp. dw_53]
MHIFLGKRLRDASVFLFFLASSLFFSASAQQPPATSDSAAQSAAQAAAQATQTGKGSKDSNKNSSKAGPDSQKAAGSSVNSDSQADNTTASGTPLDIPSTAPAPPPPGPTDRPRIGLALGGGGALALSEIGALQWFEEHHIPVDVIAGTSMGCMVSALYSTGKTVDQLKIVMNDSVFNQVFSFNSSYVSRSFRRREDSRALPNGFTIGLKHGVSFRNSVLTDQGLNSFLDRQFLRYDDRTEFNDLPIPLRCLSTDLNAAQTVTFTRGSIPNAVRASVSIPGAYRPFELNGHQFVDGAVLANLPTKTVRDMKADVVLAFSLPIAPVGKGDLNSLLGVLQRSFGVAIEGNERLSRQLADVVMIPDLDGFTQTDYLKGPDLAKRGYDVAERHKEELLKYAISDSQWQTYLAQRASRRRGPAGNLLRVRIKAPNDSITRAVQRKFADFVDKPVNTGAIESVLGEIRSDGRYDADYTVGYDDPTTGGDTSSSATPNPDTDRPTILVTVSDKSTGPPFLLVGANVEAQTAGVTRATLESIFLWQDFGGYGSEIRGNIKIGFLTQLDAEYYRRLYSTGKHGGFFVAPHGGLLRNPFYIYEDQRRISERLLQRSGGGADIGWSDSRTQELRVGWEANAIRWQTQVGSDTTAQEDLSGSMQRARIRYVYDTQDRALISQYGLRATTEFSYLYNAVSSPNAPQFTSQITYAHQISKNLFIFATEGGTTFNRNVAQPFRFTLGGPLRLTASSIDEFRGTDYFLVEPAFLRRIAKLPNPLGQSIYIGAAYEAGQMRAPDARTITRQDVYFGIVAETPLGVITLAPAIGDDGHRKFVFTLGKLF